MEVVVLLIIVTIGASALSAPRRLVEIDHFQAKYAQNKDEARASSVVQVLRESLLPAEYPGSVPPEYAKYQLLNSFQSSCSYVREFLGLSRLLQGLGVGGSGAAPTAAAMNWLLRDGVGMVGGLIFASRFGTRFNQNVKSWRLFADLVNNVGLTLEIIAPAYPRAFIPLICVAALCRSLCGISAGAANAVISSHWGEKNGVIADVAAKNGNQATLVNLICLAGALVFGKISKGGVEAMKVSTLAIVFSLLTVAHTVANMKLMSILSLRSINISRAILLADRSIRGAEISLGTVAREEPVLRLLIPSFGSSSTNCRENGLHFYSSITQVEARVPGANIETALSDYMDEPYFVVSFGGHTYCCFTGIEHPRDRARALFDCVLRQKGSSGRGDGVGRERKELADSMFPAFMDKLREAGWDTEDQALQLLPPGAKCFMRC